MPLPRWWIWINTSLGYNWTLLLGLLKLKINLIKEVLSAWEQDLFSERSNSAHSRALWLSQALRTTPECSGQLFCYEFQLFQRHMAMFIQIFGLATVFPSEKSEDQIMLFFPLKIFLFYFYFKFQNSKNVFPCPINTSPMLHLGHHEILYPNSLISNPLCKKNHISKSCQNSNSFKKLQEKFKELRNHTQFWFFGIFSLFSIFKVHPRSEVTLKKVEFSYVFNHKGCYPSEGGHSAHSSISCWICGWIALA